MTAPEVCAETEVLSRILEELQGRIGPQRYNAWFKHGTRISSSDGRLNIAVPNPFVANWIEQHYQHVLEDITEAHTGARWVVTLMIEPELCSSYTKGDLDRQAELVSRVTQGRSRPRVGSRIPEPSLKYSLDDFIVGTCNKLAYTAALATSDNDRKHFSQLFVHGSCGVGKTHLLQGICKRIGRTTVGGRPLKWRYVTAEQFTNEFIMSVRDKKGDDFRRRYRNLDFLAVDDVHFLAAKKATQDEFLHTFNAIESAGKSIIMASDTHPRLVADLNHQLVSRFMSGMVVRIDIPDRDTRTHILKCKAREMKCKLPQDVVDYISMHVRVSVRELEGILIKLSAVASLEEGGIDLAIARDVLADHLVQADSAVTVGGIEATVAPFFGITPADIHSSRRTRTVSSARMVAMYLARRHTGMSFPEIGRFMGKNHSSVVLAVKRMEQLLSGNGDLLWTTPAGEKTLPAKKVIDLLDAEIS